MTGEFILIILGFVLVAWVIWLERKVAVLEDEHDAPCDVLLSVARGRSSIRITEAGKVIVDNVEG
jgi:hypothetical protein